MFRAASFCLSLIAMLSGCTMQTHYWTKPGWTQAEFSGADLECQAMAKRLGSYAPDGEDPKWISCMQSKGWTIQRTETKMRPLF